MNDHRIPLHPQPSIFDAVCAYLGWSPDTLVPVADLADFIANSKWKAAAHRTLILAAEKERAQGRSDAEREPMLGPAGVPPRGLSRSRASVPHHFP